MAIVQNPITGRSSGTYAGAVFATQFGKNVLRSKPVSVSVSQSDASKLARQKFKALAAAVKELSPALNTFFTSKDFNMPVTSYIIGQAYDRAVSGTLNNVVVDYSKLIVPDDALGLAEYIYLTIVSEAVQVDISQPKVENLIGTDNTLDFAFYNASTGNLLGIKASVPSTSQEFAFSSSLIGATDDVKIYVKPSKSVKSKSSSELAVISS
jgi:hypothetical protein